MAGGELVEHDAEREEIGAMVGGEHAQLFGRHVGEGADGEAFLGEGGLGMKAHRLGGVVFAQLGEAEVEHLDPAVLVDHDVAGLEIAVLDPLGVGRGQGVGERHGDLEELLERQAAGRNELGEGLALDVLHGEEALAVGLFDRIDGDDVGMVERGDRLDLALEAGEAVGIFGEGRRQSLQGDLAMQAQILGEVDDPHAALTQFRQDPIVRQLRADHCAYSTVARAAICVDRIRVVESSVPLGSRICGTETGREAAQSGPPAPGPDP